MEYFSLDIDHEGVATLVFDTPDSAANVFSAESIQELGEKLRSLEGRKDIKALLFVSGKESIFIAGADINEIKTINSVEEAAEKSKIGYETFSLFRTLPFPTVAVVQGACLGGGLECVLACDYIVVSDDAKTTLGLPEVKLGIIPGWGGTQLLPKKIGLRKALTMILTGKGIPGKKAWKWGLADAIAAKEFLVEKARAFALGKKKRQEKKCWFDTCFSWLVLALARRGVIKKTKGHYQAPLAALKVIGKGIARERQVFAQLAIQPECRNLVSIFFGMENLKKESWGIESSAKRSLDNTAVLGAGTMGGGIAWLLAHRGKSVRLKDVAQPPLAKGLETAYGIWKKLLKIRKIKKHELTMNMHRISATTNFDGFQQLDLVIEAIVEDINIKKSVLSELEQHISDTTIVCSNTSSLSITEMGSVMKHPERFAGLHFFNPVNRMPLVEIIAGKQTSPETLAALVTLVRKVGKSGIVVKDGPGFLVNRLLIPYLLEAGHLLEEGASVKQIDQTMEVFGMPMGPFRLIDEVGIDVGYKVSKCLEEAYSDRMRVPRCFADCLEQGLLGKKGGKGFYLYQGKKASLNEAIEGLVPSSSEKVSPEAIVSRCIGIMVNEASRCLEEGVVSSPHYLDMAMVLGTGFPPFRGGLLRYADNYGIKKIVDDMEGLMDTFGEAYRPAPSLVSMAKENRMFTQ